MANSSSLTPVYIEGILEDGTHGRLMIISTTQPQQTHQPIQPLQAAPRVTALPQGSFYAPHSNVLTATLLTHPSTVPAAGHQPAAVPLTGPPLTASTKQPGFTEPKDFVGNIDITNLVQSIQREPGKMTVVADVGRPLCCMMKCGNDSTSEGLGRLVTDKRCRHTACLSCLIKSPNSCPVCVSAGLSVPKAENKANSNVKEKEFSSELEYGCEMCNKHFKRSSDLLRHGRMCHGINKGSFKCAVCDKGFTRSYDLKRHALTHEHDRSMYHCDKCDAKFNRVENMKRHLQAHTGIKPFQCRYCQKNFSQQENLKRHMVRHTGDYQKYQCSQCKKEFTRLASLRRHEFQHSGTYPFSCTECTPPRGFSEKGLYEKHRLTHKGIKPYVCSYCSRGFTLPKSLRNHRRIHTGERPYVCRICSSTFNQWGHLKRHKLIHERQSTSNKKSDYMKKYMWRRRQIDPSRPKLPLSAYFLWFMDARDRILRANPHLNMPQLAKAGGRLWKTINSEERQFYQKKAVTEREKYRQELEAYTKKHKHKPTVRVKDRGAIRVEASGSAGTTAKHTAKFQGENLLESAGRSVGLVPHSVVELDSGGAYSSFTGATFPVPTTGASQFYGPRQDEAGPAYEGYTRYQGTQGEDYTTQEYQLINSPSNILDFSNRAVTSHN